MGANGSTFGACAAGLTGLVTTSVNKTANTRIMEIPLTAYYRSA
jgi:hypothetical protein